MNGKKKILGILFLALATGVVPRAYAITETTTGGDLILHMDPPHPGSLTSVTLTIESLDTDLKRASIIWTHDGKVELQGLGEQSFTFETGPVGKQTSVSAQVQTAEGLRITKTVDLVPADLDIVWEAQTYTPPFYRGKALPSAGAPIRFVAVPNFITAAGQKLKPEDLLYTWSINGSEITDAAGQNTPVAHLNAGVAGGSVTVTLQAKDATGNLFADANVVVPTAPTEALLYEDSPLRGTLYHRAEFGTLPLSESEITLRAEPYYFTQDEILGQNLRYAWMLNGAPATGGQSPQTLTLRHDPGVSGTSDVGLSITSVSSPMRAAQARLLIQY